MSFLGGWNSLFDESKVREIVLLLTEKKLKSPDIETRRTVLWGLLLVFKTKLLLKMYFHTSSVKGFVIFILCNYVEF